MNQILPLIAASSSVASLIIHTLAFVAPVGLLRNFGLASITPTAKDGLGPRVWMGVLGSCARPNYSAPINCTRTTLSPKYDLSVISPKDIGSFKVATPSAAQAISICTSLVLTIVFSMLLAWRASDLWNRGKDPKPLSRKRLVATLGSGIACFLGGVIYLFLSVGFNNAIKTFNEKQKEESRIKTPDSIASLGSVLKLVWIGYILLCISLIAVLVDYFWSKGALNLKEASDTPVKTEEPENQA